MLGSAASTVKSETLQQNDSFVADIGNLPLRLRNSISFPGLPFPMPSDSTVPIRAAIVKIMCVEEAETSLMLSVGVVNARVRWRIEYSPEVSHPRCKTEEFHACAGAHCDGHNEKCNYGKNGFGS